MAFIKEKERKSLISKINHSYGFRKFLITIEIVALIGFIVVTFLSLYFTNKGNAGWAWFNSSTEKLTGLGIGMLVWAVLITLFGIIAVILTLTLKSPKKVKAEINKLQSSALSGKRVYGSDTAQDTNRSRTTFKKSKK